MFAAKFIVNSALDGVGMGLGFTLALFLMGSIREILGSEHGWGLLNRRLSYGILCLCLRLFCLWMSGSFC